MPRAPYHSIKKVINLINSGKFRVAERALITAWDDFGWNFDDIGNALKKLRERECYKTEPRYDNPKIWVDFYRANDIAGESVFTHFYVDNGVLIVDSFKELNDDEMP